MLRLELLLKLAINTEELPAESYLTWLEFRNITFMLLTSQKLGSRGASATNKLISKEHHKKWISFISRTCNLHNSR
jgi:hypothetical protein